MAKKIEVKPVVKKPEVKSAAQKKDIPKKIEIKPVVKPVAKSVVKPFVKKTPIKPSTPVDIDYKPFPNLSIPEKTPEEIEQEKRFYQMLEQQERERITRENSGLNALVPRVFGNNRKGQKE